MPKIRNKSVADILNLLPNDILVQIGEATQIDRPVSRLRGELMIKLLVFSMLRSNRLSTQQFLV